MNNQDPVQSIGQALEARIISELNATPIAAFDELLDLKNLQGNSTGYVKAFTAENLFKGTSVSINMMPGARYFNFHLIPQPGLNIPRFLFEGMAMAQGSQISMDLFPDYDVITHFDQYFADYGEAAEIYEAVRQDERFSLEPSRLLHMRAFSSPLFMLINGVSSDLYPEIEAYAGKYLDVWLGMYRQAEKLPADEAAEREQMRKRIGDTIMQRDPDRAMVVQIYGEETTQLIEKANMY